MKLIIDIESGNSACRTREDVLGILDTVRDKLRLAGTGSKHNILDSNGQSVGYYSISQDDPDEDEEDSEDEEEGDLSDTQIQRAGDVPMARPYRDDAPTSEAIAKILTTFRTTLEAQTYTVRHFISRTGYVGPAVDVDTWGDVFAVGRALLAANIPISYDFMGDGYIVYPKV